MIRSFDWRDFPALHRHRRQGLVLDADLALTRWMTLVPAGALLATLAPATGIFTYVGTNEDNSSRPVIGQFTHTSGAQTARLTFITPEDEINSPDAPALLDHLAAQAGRHGALNLLAEVNEKSEAYDALRKAGFAIYTRQQIWEIIDRPDDEKSTTTAGAWRPAVVSDEAAVHGLYRSLIPALVQQSEPPPWIGLNGLVYDPEGELLAYLHLHYGPTGIMAHPFLHPDIEPVTELLGSLAENIAHRRNRPLYLAVRSHQAWLGPHLQELGFKAGERQAVMVRRLAVAQRMKMPLKLPGAALENVQPEITTTLSSAGEGVRMARNRYGRHRRG